MKGCAGRNFGSRELPLILGAMRCLVRSFVDGLQREVLDIEAVHFTGVCGTADLGQSVHGQQERPVDEELGESKHESPVSLLS